MPAVSTNLHIRKGPGTEYSILGKLPIMTYAYILEKGDNGWTKISTGSIEEGYVRELISKVQTMRKEAGFEVMDHITLYVTGNDKLADLFAKNEAEVKSVVLADSLVFGSADGYVKDWDLNGENVTLGVKKN